MRFSALLAEFSATLDMLPDSRLARVRGAFAQAVADHPAARKRALGEGKPEPLVDLAGVIAALPDQLQGEGRALERALRDEGYRRPGSWALDHGAQAIMSFVPQLAPEPATAATPLTADEKRAAAAEKAEAEALALEERAAAALKEADERRERVKRFRDAQSS